VQIKSSSFFLQLLWRLFTSRNPISNTHWEGYERADMVKCITMQTPQTSLIARYPSSPPVFPLTGGTLKPKIFFQRPFRKQIWCDQICTYFRVNNYHSDHKRSANRSWGTTVLLLHPPQGTCSNLLRVAILAFNETLCQKWKWNDSATFGLLDFEEYRGLLDACYGKIRVKQVIIYEITKMF